MYAGEHTAGTEFMIGPLFVAWGVGPFDLLVGLLLGNILAVLSWRYVCTPIAVKYRLTLYKHLERICGRGLVTVYNLANGILFCFLAGAMITVSATAVGIPFDIPMPGLDDFYPTSLSWIIIVVAIGIVVSIVASVGYDAVSRLANLAAPWMILIFIGCALVTIPKLEVNSLSEIWTGVPLLGLPKLGFWHVLFFSWLCNAAMHIGMSDLSILRFAKKKTHGWAPAVGMFLGHYIAWIAASLLFALAIQRFGPTASNAPGPMVNDALGIAGLICVVVAGWTTANPTIYRAGLAFQSLMPKRSRFTVTLIAGLLATTAGIFPAFAMKLLNFVGIYGTILAPMGAVIFFTYHVTDRLGLKNYAATPYEGSINLAALYAWVIPVSFAGFLMIQDGDLFPSFLTLPVWIASGMLYILFELFYQKGSHLAKPLSLIGLASVIIAPVLFSLGSMGDSTMKTILIAGTACWFISVPVYLGIKKTS